MLSLIYIIKKILIENSATKSVNILQSKYFNLVALVQWLWVFSKTSNLVALVIILVAMAMCTHKIMDILEIQYLSKLEDNLVIFELLAIKKYFGVLWGLASGLP